MEDAPYAVEVVITSPTGERLILTGTARMPDSISISLGVTDGHCMVSFDADRNSAKRAALALLGPDELPARVA
ncbi:hypothetical protein EON81_29435 [bacterium]|nr:MAG: hypothetical protein EON81_29435 [bacterium]